MEGAIRVSGPINAEGTVLSLETGKLARLAAGAVLVQIGDTRITSYNVCYTKLLRSTCFRLWCF